MAAVMPVSMTIQPSTSHGNGLVIRPNLQLSSKGGVAIPYGMEVDGPGRRLRKNVANVRRHVDYVCSVINYAEQRLWQYGGRRQRLAVQPDELYQNSSLPIHRTPDVPVDCVLSKLVRAATNKIKAPIYSICWSPEGKRLITGSSNGEFTLWNGTAFNFETILQAHDSGIRAMKWSYNEQWLLSADADGYVKYWQPNMNNAHMFAAHKGESVRGIAFAPTDAKFVTAADDGTARVWDFGRCTEEKVLRGHGSEVRCVDWHPTKGLVVTGSRDTQQPVKLWDPKSGQCLSTFQEHKNSVMGVEFNRNGNWLLTGGRDHLVKVYDIRVMKELKTFRAHKKEVISVAWHPIHEGLFCSGGGDGTIVYWMMGQEKEVGLLEQAHDQAIWSMKWHPLGHILTTCSNDSSTKFWARNRPGDTTEDVYGLCSIANMVGALDKEREPKPAPRPAQMEMENEYQTNVHIPGMGLDEEIYLQINKDGISTDSAILLPDDVTRVGAGPMIGAKRTLIKQPPAKRAQKQFERMWNNSTGIGAGSDDYLMGGPTITPSMLDRRPKHMGMMGGPVTPSLLGHKPSPSLLGPRPGGPPPGGPPPQHGNFRGPPPGQGRDYNSMPPPPQQHQQQQQQQRRDFSKPPPPTPQQPQQNGGRPEDRGPPPAVPPGLKFNAQGVPMIPPGLPPHLWPMPPGKGGAPTGAPPTQPPPGQRPLDGDHDYRSGPPPPVRNQTVDVDLRAPPPTMNMQQPPPAMNRQQQPQPPLTIHAKNMNYPPPTAQSQFNHPPPNRVGPPVQQQQQQRPQWPPQQQHQQQQHQNQPAPPQPSHDPRSDPRNDPRLRQKKEENKPQPQQGWMPQFNKTDQSWR